MSILKQVFSTNQVRNPMDRLVSAYRNKLECRAGKEYYYKVSRYYHKKKNIVMRKTILNRISKYPKMPSEWPFYALVRLQEHGRKAVESYRKAGKLKFGEERWRQKFRNCVPETFHDKSKVQRDAKLASRLSHRGTWFIWPVEILLLCGGGAQFLGVCSVCACPSYRRPPLETLHSGLWEWPRQAYIFVPDDLRMLGLSHH